MERNIIETTKEKVNEEAATFKTNEKGGLLKATSSPEHNAWDTNERSGRLPESLGISLSCDALPRIPPCRGQGRPD